MAKKVAHLLIEMAGQLTLLWMNKSLLSPNNDKWSEFYYLLTSKSSIVKRQYQFLLWGGSIICWYLVLVHLCCHFYHSKKTSSSTVAYIHTYKVVFTLRSLYSRSNQYHSTTTGIKCVLFQRNFLAYSADAHLLLSLRCNSSLKLVTKCRTRTQTKVTGLNQ